MAVVIPLVAAEVGALALGSQAGWAIGMAIGSYIAAEAFAPKNPTNSISDLSVQTASWGTSLPQVFGTQKVAGNIIWSTDKKLVGGSSGKWGGKGGGGGGKKGGGSQGYYVCSLALALCEGPIAGVKRIWAGADLIFDDGNPVYIPSNDTSNPQAGGYQTFTSTNTPITSTGMSSLGSWTLYHGTQDQGADPLIVANGSGLGTNGVPYEQVTMQNGFEYTYGSPSYGKLGTACAYKGVCYIVFDNMNLGYAGSIPPLSFEVVSAGTTNPIQEIQAFQQIVPYSVTNDCFAVDQSFSNIVTIDGRPDLYSNISNFSVQSKTISTVYNPFNNFLSNGATISPQTVAYNQADGSFEYASENIVLGKSPSNGGGMVISAVTNANAFNSISGTFAGSSVWFFGENTGQIYSAEDVSGQLSTLPHYNITSIYTFPEAPSGGWPRAFATLGSTIYWLGATSGRLISFNGSGNAAYDSASGLGTGRLYSDGTFLYHLGAAVANGTNQTYDLYSFGPGGFGLSVDRTLQAPTGSSLISICFYNNEVFGAVKFSSGANSLVKFNADGTVRYTLDIPFTFYLYDMIPVSQGIALFGTTSSGNFGFGLYSGGDTSINATDPTIADIISAVCDRAGLTKYDVSLLPAKTLSMHRPAGTPARDILSMLTKLYQIDMVDSAGTLKFVPKGQDISAVLGTNDIGFGKPRVGPMPAPYTMTRAQGTDLPRKLVLKYISKTANYNQSAEQYEINNPDGKDITAQVPVTLDWGTAISAAYILCVSPHIERTAYTWTTSFAWLSVEPGDVLQMPWGVTRVTRVALKDVQNVPVIEMSGVIDASYVMTNGAGMASAVAPPELAGAFATPIPLPTSSGSITGSGGSGTGTTNQPPTKPVVNPGIAYAAYFEVPPLDSTQTTPFYIVSAYSSGDAFIGAAIYESTDGGTTYSQIAEQTNSGVVGHVANQPAIALPYTWDTTTVLNVYLNNAYMALSSATDLQVLNGANLALVGAELIQFANATLKTDSNGTPYYELSRLLRGRAGTEGSIGTQQPGTKFVLVNPNDEAIIAYARTDLYQTHPYKVATVGQDISAVSVTNFAPTGVYYRPRTVSHVKWSIDSSNNWNLTFLPVSRLNGAFSSGITPSLDPDVQTWIIQIRNGTNADIGGGNLLREVTGLSLSTPNWQYTAAMQTADGLTPGALTGVYYLIAQVSSVTGAGNPTVGPIQ